MHMVIIDHLDVCLSETVNPEGQESDLFNSLAPSLVEQGPSEKSTETAAPAQLCRDSPWGPSHSALWASVSPTTIRCTWTRGSLKSHPALMHYENKGPKVLRSTSFHDICGQYLLRVWLSKISQYSSFEWCGSAIAMSENSTVDI